MAEDSLATRRSKRSTAGNRMEAALAEMNIEDLMQDVEEDVDFVSKVEEEDVFESDFASTEEEEEDDEAGEKALEEEERRARRAARSKGFKIPTAPQLKVKFDISVTKDEESPLTPGGTKSKQSRRVSLGPAVDAETGEVVESSKRQSTREATRLNTQDLRTRLKDAESRKASVITPKRPKGKKRRLTQADLITSALDLEEENTKSHREYLAVEEERRKKARVVKPTTVGPKIRWRSRCEDVTITIYESAPQPAYMSRPAWPSPYTNPSGHPTPSYTPYTHPPPPGQSSQTPSTPRPYPLPTYSLPYTSVPSATPTTAPTVTTFKVPASSVSTTQDSNTTATPPSASTTSKSTTTKPGSSKQPLATPPTKTISLPLTALSSPPITSPQAIVVSKKGRNDSETPTPSTSAAATIPANAPATSSSAAPVSASTSTPIAPSQPVAPYPSYYPPYPYYPPQTGQTAYNPYNYYPYAASTAYAQANRLQLQPAQQIARKTTEKQAKNYVEVLLDEERPKEKPGWRQTMDSMFGYHVDWDEIRVYYGKTRPLARQMAICPVTGMLAKYRDPRSLVPFANTGAFRILTRLLEHEYVWSPTGAGDGVFVGHEKQRGAVGVPDRWGAAMGGVSENWQRNQIEPPKKEEKPTDKGKGKLKGKEYRVGDRRSSRFAGNAGESSAVTPMEVDEPQPVPTA